MTLPTLSASKLKVFVTCHKQFHYRYILDEPTPKHQAAAVGSAVHRTIEAVTKQRQDPVTKFLTEYSKEVAEYGLSPDQRYINDGITIVGNYDYLAYSPDEMEVEFRLNFPNDKNPICTIHGFIDQMYDWGFVDLKTNRKKPAQEELDNDLQFILYAWAYKRLKKKAPKSCIWHHLRTGEQIVADVIGKEDYAASVIQELLQCKAEDNYVIRRGTHCKWCAFRVPCFAEDSNGSAR